MRSYLDIFWALLVGLGIGIVQHGIINRPDGLVMINAIMIAVLIYLINRRTILALIIALSAGYYLDWLMGSYWPIHVIGIVISATVFLLVYRRIFVNETWISLVTSSVLANLVYAIYITIYTAINNGQISRDQWDRVAWSYLGQTICMIVVMYFVYRNKRQNLFTVRRV